MMKSPLISIIIPIYNVEKFLSQCLDSILAQTHKNLEIVLVDDGSPDRSGEICDKYAKRDQRIRVIHKQNAGVAEARITGFENCTGEYIAFIDSDDYVDPDYIRHLFYNMKKYNVSMSCCQLVNVYSGKTFNDDRPEIGLFEGKRKIDFLSTDFFYSYKLRKAGFFVGQGGKMYKREWVLDALKAGQGLTMGEDILMLFYLIQRIPSLFISPSFLYYYTQHPSQATRKIDIETWNNLIKQWERIAENDPKGYLKAQLSYRILCYFRSFAIKGIRKKSYQEYNMYLDKMQNYQIIQDYMISYKYEKLSFIDRLFIFLLKKSPHTIRYLMYNAFYIGMKLFSIKQ